MRVKDIEHDGYNLTNIYICVHNGTHIDAPCHFVENGKSVAELPLDAFFGDCTVVSADGVVDAEQMEKFVSDVPPIATKRILIKGKCLLSDEALAVVARSHVRLIGVESQTIANPDSPKNGHLLLLSNGIIPLEGLDLSEVPDGVYTLAAYPLKMWGSDGSPVRAVLMCY